MLKDTIERIEAEHNIKKPIKHESCPKMPINGFLTYTEYCVLFRYSLDHNAETMFDGLRKLIREEGRRQLDSDGDN